VINLIRAKEMAQKVQGKEEKTSVNIEKM